MANSLSSRLTCRIMAGVLVMMVVITNMLHYAVRESMLLEAQARYLAILHRIQSESRHIQEAIGMSPVDYRIMMTRDL